MEDIYLKVNHNLIGGFEHAFLDLNVFDSIQRPNLTNVT